MEVQVENICLKKVQTFFQLCKLKTMKSIFEETIKKAKLCVQDDINQIYEQLEDKLTTDEFQVLADRVVTLVEDSQALGREATLEYNFYHMEKN